MNMNEEMAFKALNREKQTNEAISELLTWMIPKDSERIFTELENFRKLNTKRMNMLSQLSGRELIELYGKDQVNIRKVENWIMNKAEVLRKFHNGRISPMLQSEANMRAIGEKCIEKDDIYFPIEVLAREIYFSITRAIIDNPYENLRDKMKGIAYTL